MSAAGLPVEVTTQAQGMILTKLAIGFESDEEIVDNVTELLEDDFHHPDVRAEVERLTEELAALHAQNELMWTEQTDCDRLNVAFAALESRGIIARQNFSCCGTCGQVEIGDEVAKSATAGHEVRGFTFYHWQDSERAQEYGSLYLYYGAVAPGEPAWIALAQDVVETLRAHGFRVCWDGDIRERIVVDDLVWRRRRIALPA